MKKPTGPFPKTPIGSSSKSSRALERLMGPPVKTQWDACLRILERASTQEDRDYDPLVRVRGYLIDLAVVLAPKYGQNPDAWSAYAEKHLAGVRFMLRDATGREIDLQKIPGSPEDLSTWRPS